MKNSHVDGIRELKDVINVVVSKPMTEEAARQKEAELIQKYQPEFNTDIPKIRFDSLIVSGVSRSSLNLDLTPLEVSLLRQVYDYLEDMPVLVEDRYMVWRDDKSSNTRFSFKIKDGNCTKPIRYICNQYSSVSKLSFHTEYDNLYVESIAREPRSFIDVAKLPLAILDLFLEESLPNPPKFLQRAEDSAVESICIPTGSPWGAPPPTVFPDNEPEDSLVEEVTDEGLEDIKEEYYQDNDFNRAPM